MPKNAKRPMMHAANGQDLKKWRKEIGKMAALTLRGGSPAGKKVALRVRAVFVMPQARSNKNIEAVGRPDLDKLVRALLDGLTGIVMEDDSQVTELFASKEYGQEPRMEVIVEECSAAQELLRLAPPKDLPF
jgi:Holliday junction resolvase RusA-like endonuclease